MSRQSLSKQDAVIADLQTQITALRAQSRRGFHVPCAMAWKDATALQGAGRLGCFTLSRCSLRCQPQAFWLSVLLRLWCSSGILCGANQPKGSICGSVANSIGLMHVAFDDWEFHGLFLKGFMSEIGRQQLSFLLYLCDVPPKSCWAWRGTDLLRSPQQMHWPATWTSCRSYENNVALRLRNKDWPGCKHTGLCTPYAGHCWAYSSQAVGCHVTRLWTPYGDMVHMMRPDGHFGASQAPGWQNTWSSSSSSSWQ